MKTKLLVLTMLFLIVNACTNDSDRDFNVNLASSLEIGIKTTEDENEMKMIETKGFRLIEMDEDGNYVNQAVWKKSGDSWQMDGEVSGGRAVSVVGIYPTCDKLADNIGKVEMQAGINNMTARGNVDDGKVDLLLRHEMCHVACTLEDGKMNKSKTKIKLTQPEKMAYDVKDGTVSCNGLADILVPEDGTYVIPSEENCYKFIVVKDEKTYSYKVKGGLKRNKRYLFNLAFKKENLVLSGVKVQDWGETVVEEGDLTEIENEKPSPIDFEWVDIPAGEFMMGSNVSEDEKPVRQVKITKGFKMSKFLVTFQQYDAFCEATGRELANDRGWGRGSRPAVSVRYTDALEFCKWAGVRLPTEAEWEYACRAGSNTVYYWGDKMEDDYCWYDENAMSKTHPVGKKMPNKWGLYDMIGNVWEWCADWYGPYRPEETSNPAGPSTGEERVARGGSWMDNEKSCRAANRSSFKPTSKRVWVGFRVCR